MDEICQHPTEESLAMAKYRIDHEYLYVGLSDELSNSLQILQKLLPGFFGHETNWIVPHERASIRHDDVANSPDSHTLTILRRANALDLELYEHIRRRHLEFVRTCALRT